MSYYKKHNHKKEERSMEHIDREVKEILGGGKKMKRVVFFNGTFDGINAGHVRAIQEVVKKYAYYCGSESCNCTTPPELIVGVNSDALVNWMIGSDKKSQNVLALPYAQRAEIVFGIKGVTKVIETHEPSALNYLKKYNADVYVLTEEWKDAQKDAIEWMLANGKTIHYSPRYEDIYCNSQIRRRIIEGNS